MSTHKEKTIGSVSIDQLLAESVKRETAQSVMAGGDADSLHGWQTRLKLSQKRARQIIFMLLEDGRAVRVKGYQLRNGAPYSCELIQSKVLEEAAK